MMMMTKFIMMMIMTNYMMMDNDKLHDDEDKLHDDEKLHDDDVQILLGYWKLIQKKSHQARVGVSHAGAQQTHLRLHTLSLEEDQLSHWKRW